MFGIIKKDLVFTAGYLLFLPPMMLYWILTRDSLDTTALFMMSAWIFIITLGSMLAVEMNELKSRGYVLLAVLPVGAGEIAAGKLIPAAAQVVVYTSVIYLSFGIFEADPGWTAFARGWLIFNSAVALSVTSFIYWVTARFGFGKASIALGILLAVSFVSPIAFNEMMIRGYIGRSSGIFRMAGGGANIAAAACSTAIFIVMFFLSVRALRGDVRA
jgi:hypothetical protein